jgi:dihydrofolate reductase
VTVRIVLIAAVARNGVIGRGGALPWRLPDDLARFQRLTRGKPVVMGRRTFSSIGKPLPHRHNLVLSRTADAIPGCTVVRSVDEAIAAAGDADELWVIGGEAVYAAFLPRADVLELTEVDAEIDGDARFPTFDRSAFRVVREEHHPADARHAYPFRFMTYERTGR